MSTTMQPSASALEVTRQTLADPSLSRRSPGEEFSWAVAQARDAVNVVVPIRAHLTASFPLFATRPRYTVRHLLKVASVSDRTLAYVREAPKSQYGPAMLPCCVRRTSSPMTNIGSPRESNVTAKKFFA